MVQNIWSCTYADVITMKSMIFHTSRRYEFGCKTRPLARILHAASTMNMPKKIGSASSSCMANGVRSLSGKCSSIAIVTHVAIIVTKTVYSNGGHSIMNLNSRRIGFWSPNMNSDDGPGCVGSPAAFPFLFFFDDTTFTLTFWPEFVVVAVIWVSTFAPDDASWTAALILFYFFFFLVGRKGRSPIFQRTRENNNERK